MPNRTALVRYTQGMLSMLLVLIVAMFAFSHYGVGDPWTAGGPCYSHPLIVQTCHLKVEPAQSTVTLVRVRGPVRAG
jgi:hypothetical protein